MHLFCFQKAFYTPNIKFQEISAAFENVYLSYSVNKVS